MARAQVGRPPKGGVAQERSETAKRAYIAARLAQRSDAGFLDELGLDLNTTAISRAGAHLLWRPPHYKPRGRKAAGASGNRERAADEGTAGELRDWLAINAASRDVSTALITLEFASRREQRSAYRDLRRVMGVAQLITVTPGYGTHQLVAVVLSDGERDRQRLRERLDEVGGTWLWQDIELHTVEPAVGTWRHLTRVAGRRETLLKR